LTPLPAHVQSLTSVLDNSDLVQQYNEALGFRVVRATFPWPALMWLVFAWFLHYYREVAIVAAAFVLPIQYHPLLHLIHPATCLLAMFLQVFLDDFSTHFRGRLVRSISNTIGSTGTGALCWLSQTGGHAFSRAGPLSGISVTTSDIAHFVRAYESAQLYSSAPRVQMFQLPGTDGIRLKGFYPAQSLATLLALPLHPGASLQVKMEPPEPVHDRPMVAAGIFSYHTLSVGVFNRSHETHLACIKRRLLQPSLRIPTNPTYSIALEMAYVMYHRLHISVFGDRGAAEPYPAAGWIASYPLHQQARLLREKMEAELDQYDRDFFRGLFYKRECTAKLTAAGFTGERPRAIQSGQGALHFRVVEGVLGTQKYLSQHLHPSRDLPWVVVSSATPEEAGARFGRIVQSGSVSFEEDDDSDHDRNNGLLSILSNAETMCYLCPRPDLIYQLRQAGPMRGYCKQNYVVSLPEPSVHSGDLSTYVGNTLTTLKRNMFVDSLWLRRGSCIFCEEELKTDQICANCRDEVESTDSVFERVGPFRGTYQMYAREPEVDATPNTVEGALLRRYDNLVWRMSQRLKSPNDTAEILRTTTFASGDDSLKAIDADAAVGKGGFSESVNAKMGWKLKSKIHEGPDCHYRATFCSAVFLPTSIGYVMAPKLGRWLIRMGFYVDPPSYKNKELRSLVRGDMMGRRSWVQAYPFLRELVERQLQLTEGAVGKIRPNRRYADWHGVTSTFTETDETWHFMNTRYGLNRDDLRTFQAMLMRVTSLPAMVNFTQFVPAINLDNDRDQEDSDF